MKQYLRAAAVTVGKGATVGTKFSGLRIGFEIEKSTESTPNDAKISIYNLSEKSRAALEDSDLMVRLDVGYWGDNRDPSKLALSQLFVGNIRYTSSTRQGADYVSTIEAGDGEKALTKTTHEQSFPANTPMTTVIKLLSSKLDVAVGSIAPAIGKVFENGFSFSGLVSNALDDLTKSADLEWHVTDGELNILPKGATTNEPAIFVNAETGLIGTPSKRRSDKNSPSDRPTGYEFQMLINPEVKPGRIVQVESKIVKAAMKVDRARFRGDTHVGDWIAKVEAS